MVVLMVGDSWPGRSLREHGPAEGQGKHFGEIVKELLTLYGVSSLGAFSLLYSFQVVN